MKLYKIVRESSVLLRGWMFGHLIEQLNISDNIIINYAISIAASYVIHAVSFAVVGLFYNKGEDTATGAFMYFIAWVNYTFWTWLALRCYIASIAAGTFASMLLYIAIGAMVVINIAGIIFLKRLEVNRT